MRHFSGSVVKTTKFHFPASIIISGSSGAGKTSFIEKLIEKQHFSKEIKYVHYFSCSSIPNAGLNWHNSLRNIAVTYHQGLPNAQFFSTISPNSIVVIDDQFETAVESQGLRLTMKNIT